LDQLLNLLNAYYLSTYTYTTFAVLHTLQITKAHYQSLQSATPSSTHWLVTASNSGDFSASMLMANVMH
jgi:hypothetical protein